jgi:cytochrome c oxidase subunit 3
MATTIPEPPKIKEHRSSGASNGNGFSFPGQGNVRAVQEYAPPPARTGIWVFLAAATMTFAAFTSALIVRRGAAMDWHHLTLPRILYWNTVVLLISSGTLERARRRIAVFMGGTKAGSAPAGWLQTTALLGGVFVAGQYAAWLELRAEGLYLATNPNSSFFYLLTALHGLHVLGGLFGLAYVMRKLRRLTLRRSTLETFAIYWHFMAALWVYLLLLMWTRI